jgi:membrane associated rhomboid family serine protease
LLAQLGEDEEPRAGDQRLAIILIAIAVAMAAGVMFAVDDPGVIRLGIAAALFPLLIGGALLLNQYLAERRQRASGK